jgi:GAF domain-containing protein
VGASGRELDTVATDEQDAASNTGDPALAAALREALTRAMAATAIAPATPPDRLLSRLLRAAATAIPSPAGSLLLVDPVAGALTFDVVIGPAASSVAGLTVPLGRGIAGLVAASGQPLAIANAQQDPRHARDIAERAGYLPTTILAVPVTDADGAVIAVLELLDRQGAPTFSLADMELLGQFAGLCAIALERRRAEALAADLIGRALVLAGGLPAEAQQALAAPVQALADRVAADPVARRARALGEQVAAIAARGEAEQRACAGVLAVFADYLAAHPAPGAGTAAYLSGAAFVDEQP